MNVGDERTNSNWMDVDLPADRPSLTGDTQADVVVIGGGLTGLSVAYELLQAGRGVTMIDRGRVGRGQSARTTAQLAWQLDDYYHELRRERGDDDAGAERFLGLLALDDLVAGRLDRARELRRLLLGHEVDDERLPHFRCARASSRSLSPRPDRQTTITSPSSSPARARACAGSSAGMIPSVSASLLNATRASSSVAARYSTRPVSRRYACSGPTPG